VKAFKQKGTNQSQLITGFPPGNVPLLSGFAVMARQIAAP
jgi:hypothetical protein